MPYTNKTRNVHIPQHCDAFAYIHCCNTKATVCSRSTVDIHVAVNIILKALQWSHNNASYLPQHYICCCQQYETHLGLQIKCLIFLSDFNHIWIFLDRFSYNFAT